MLRHNNVNKQSMNSTHCWQDRDQIALVAYRIQHVHHSCLNDAQIKIYAIYVFSPASPSRDSNSKRTAALLSGIYVIRCPTQFYIDLVQFASVDSVCILFDGTSVKNERNHIVLVSWVLFEEQVMVPLEQASTSFYLMNRLHVSHHFSLSYSHCFYTMSLSILLPHL